VRIVFQLLGSVPSAQQDSRQANILYIVPFAGEYFINNVKLMIKSPNIHFKLIRRDLVPNRKSAIR